ncbi:MAG: trypsin-like peptidase domain-containing protein, partial [Gammaproteobacteria bacterium]|nr:trypsin-like peptidase domain-containing protein [Gammaproteobacteria bacterium]
MAQRAQTKVISLPAKNGERRRFVLACFVLAATVFILSSCASSERVLRIDSAAAPVFLGDGNQCNEPNNFTRNSVVRVATDEGSDGSGVVVADGRVLTAAHVVEDSDAILVYINEEFRQARRLATDMEHDLALLSVDTGALNPLRLAETGLRIREPVWAIGFPLALDQRTTEGYLRTDTGKKLYTSARIDAGNSGGGLIRCMDGEHQLAGIVSSYGAYWHEGE